MGACVEGSILFEGAQVGEGTVARNLIVGLGAIIHGGCIVRGLFVLGAGRVDGAKDELDLARGPTDVGVTIPHRSGAFWTTGSTQ